MSSLSSPEEQTPFKSGESVHKPAESQTEKVADKLRNIAAKTSPYNLLKILSGRKNVVNEQTVKEQAVVAKDPYAGVPKMEELSPEDQARVRQAIRENRLRLAKQAAENYKDELRKQGVSEGEIQERTRPLTSAELDAEVARIKKAQNSWTAKVYQKSPQWLKDYWDY